MVSGGARFSQPLVPLCLCYFYTLSFPVHLVNSSFLRPHLYVFLPPPELGFWQHLRPVRRFTVIDYLHDLLLWTVSSSRRVKLSLGPSGCLLKLLGWWKNTFLRGGEDGMFEPLRPWG